MIDDRPKDNHLLQILLTEYTATRTELYSMSSNIVLTATLMLAGIAAGLTAGRQFESAPLQIVLPFFLVGASWWTVNQIYSFLYRATYTSILERRINNEVDGAGLEWEIHWSALRVPRIQEENGNIRIDNYKAVGFSNIAFILNNVIFGFMLFGIYVYLVTDATLTILNFDRIGAWNWAISVVYIAACGLSVISVLYLYRLWWPAKLDSMQIIWEKWYGLDPISLTKSVA